MNRKVSELFNHQTVLSERHGIITLLIDGGSTGESALPAGAPVPKPRPDRRASAGATGALAYAAADPFATDSISAKILSNDGSSAQDESAAGRADRMFVAIDRSLRSIEAGQMRKIRTLTENAYRTADR